MEDESLASGEIENTQDDKGSNHGGSTASHSSEEFVKVNKDEAILDEAAGDNTRADVEELLPISSDPAESSLLDKIDPREAEPQLVIEPEPSLEVEQEVVQEETQEVQTQSSDIREEVRDIPDLPAVEDVETKSERTSISSQIPTAVIDLVYWKDVKKTASVFSFLLVVLSSLICFSVISVFSYVGLSLLTVTVAFRLYRLVVQTLNGTQQPHPFQEYLDLDVSLSEERVHKYASAILGHLNCTFTAARDLLLVKHTISSLKFGIFLWILTYVGALFNGLTLLIIDTIIIFTVPPIYQKYQTPINNYYGMAREKIVNLTSKVKAKLPGAKKEKTQ